MATLLREKFRLRESPEVPVADWSALFRELQSVDKLSNQTIKANKSVLGDETTDITIAGLWDIYYNTEWVENGPFSNFNDAKSALDSLGIAFKTELLALGFYERQNPFIGFVNKNSKYIGKLVTRTIYDTIHNAAIDDNIDKNDIANATIGSGSISNILNYIELYKQSQSDFYQYLILTVELNKALRSAKLNSDATKITWPILFNNDNTVSITSLIQEITNLGSNAVIFEIVNNINFAGANVNQKLTSISLLKALVSSLESLNPDAQRKQRQAVGAVFNSLQNLDAKSAKQLGFYFLSTYGDLVQNQRDFVQMQQKLDLDNTFALSLPQLTVLGQKYGPSKIVVDNAGALGHIIDILSTKINN